MVQERLKARRRELGLSQEEMAKAVGLSMKAYCTYELGQRSPKVDTALKIAKKLHRSVEFLFGEETKYKS